MAVSLHRPEDVTYVLDDGSLRAQATAFQIDAFARRYYELFNRRQFEEAERFVDPQAVFVYPAAREHFIGRAGYRELVRRWITGFPDGRLSITSVHVGEGPAAYTDWIAEGTHLGVLELPGFPPIPPTGVRAQLPMRETIRIAEGMIVESRMEFDPDELRRRLGL